MVMLLTFEEVAISQTHIFEQNYGVKIYWYVLKFVLLLWYLFIKVDLKCNRCSA